MINELTKIKVCSWHLGQNLIKYKPHIHYILNIKSDLNPTWIF